MKKHQQLGMNAGTASHRLVKDLLFKFVQEAGHVCHRCKKPLTREDFSIEHVEPWLDSAEPARLFFDLSNIAYSHKLCNSLASRREKIHEDEKALSRSTSQRYREQHPERVREQKRSYRARNAA
jgi:hypothetical protein